MKYFSYTTDQQLLKKQYRELAKQHHPDMPTGNEEVMKEIIAEYEQINQRKTIWDGASNYHFNGNDIEDAMDDVLNNRIVTAIIIGALGVYLLRRAFR